MVFLSTSLFVYFSYEKNGAAFGFNIVSTQILPKNTDADQLQSTEKIMDTISDV